LKKIPEIPTCEKEEKRKEKNILNTGRDFLLCPFPNRY
jgi:hypothetical protein